MRWLNERYRFEKWQEKKTDLKTNGNVLAWNMKRDKFWNDFTLIFFSSIFLSSVAASALAQWFTTVRFSFPQYLFHKCNEHESTINLNNFEAIET